MLRVFSWGCVVGVLGLILFSFLGSRQGDADSTQKGPTVVHVAKSGGDFAEVREAIDSIVDASADNRYLVRIAPGQYAGFAMKRFVDVAGASKWLTTITQTVVSHRNAELRNLRVAPVSAGADNIAIRVPADNQLRARNVNIDVAGAERCVGIAGKGMKAEAALRVVEIAAACPTATTGIQMQDGNVDLKNVRLQVTANTAVGIDARSGRLETVTLAPDAGNPGVCGTAKGIIAHAQSWRLRKSDIHMRGCNNVGIDFQQETEDDVVASLGWVRIHIDAVGIRDSVAIGNHLGIRSIRSTKMFDVTVRGGPPPGNAAIVLKGGEHRLTRVDIEDNHSALATHNSPSVLIRDSRLMGKNRFIVNFGQPSFRIVRTQMNGIILNIRDEEGDYSCSQVYDRSLNPFSCP